MWYTIIWLSPSTCEVISRRFFYLTNYQYLNEELLQPTTQSLHKKRRQENTPNVGGGNAANVASKKSAKM